MKIKTVCALVLLMLAASLAMAQTITRCGGPTNAIYINWPTFGFDVCHTGYNAYEHILGPDNVGKLVQAWKAFALEGLQSSLTVVDGVVYFGSANVQAMDAVTGKLLWQTGIGGNLVPATPAVANGMVYATSSTPGALYALDARTGFTRWTYPIGTYNNSSPTVADGLVYFGSDDGSLYALNASTGAFVWRYATGDRIWSSPAVVNGLVYFGSWGGNLYAVNAHTGTLLWSRQLGQQITDTPTVASGVVYVGEWYSNSLYALDAHTGAQLWKYTAGSGILSGVAVANGVVYLATEYDNTLWAIDAHTGILIWKYTTGNNLLAAPVVANGVVYLGSLDHYFYAFNATTGALLGQYSVGSSYFITTTAAVVNGTLYFGTNSGCCDGYVYAFHLPEQ